MTLDLNNLHPLTVFVQEVVVLMKQKKKGAGRIESKYFVVRHIPRNIQVYILQLSDNLFLRYDK